MFPRKLMNSISHDLSIHLRGKKNAQELNRKQFRKLVGATGFEPATPCAQGRCATRLRYAPTVLGRSYPLHIEILAQARAQPFTSGPLAPAAAMLCDFKPAESATTVSTGSAYFHNFAFDGCVFGAPLQV